MEVCKIEHPSMFEAKAFGIEVLEKVGIKVGGDENHNS